LLRAASGPVNSIHCEQESLVRHFCTTTPEAMQKMKTQSDSLFVDRRIKRGLL
jgi:hypothetical protein